MCTTLECAMPRWYMIWKLILMKFWNNIIKVLRTSLLEVFSIKFFIAENPVFSFVHLFPGFQVFPAFPTINNFCVCDYRMLKPCLLNTLHLYTETMDRFDFTDLKLQACRSTQIISKFALCARASLFLESRIRCVIHRTLLLACFNRIRKKA
jgi:hypothetical protein